MAVDLQMLDISQHGQTQGINQAKSQENGVYCGHTYSEYTEKIQLFRNMFWEGKAETETSITHEDLETWQRGVYDQNHRHENLNRLYGK